MFNWIRAQWARWFSPPLVVSVSPIDEMLIENPSKLVPEVTVTGGRPPYTYLWIPVLDAESEDAGGYVYVRPDDSPLPYLVSAAPRGVNRGNLRCTVTDADGKQVPALAPFEIRHASPLVKPVRE